MECLWKIKMETKEQQIIELEAQVAEYKANAERFRSLTSFDRVVTTNELIVQVIDVIGRQLYYFNLYHKAPKGQTPPDVLYSSKLDALRAAVDAAIKNRAVV